jgi:glycosyltransferase involved in cell wall biosynthesis
VARAARNAGHNPAVPPVSVIVPAHNAAATIGATIAALEDQDAEFEWDVIVVDDGSTDETPGIVGRAGPRVRLVSQPKAGPGPARDRGVRESEAELLAFTDADCVPTRGWLREGVAALAPADLVQGAVRPDPGAVPRPFDRSIWVNGRGGLYETANLLVRRELFEEIGGFDDWLRARLGKPLAEDVWFGWRARRAGARIAYSEAAMVHHAVFRRGMREYAGERLRLYYFPAIVGRIPELRGELLVDRVFLNRRTRELDVAVLGVAAAIVARSPLPLALAIPYARTAIRGARRWGRLAAPRALAGDVAADLAGCAALLGGSVRNRTPVL